MQQDADQHETWWHLQCTLTRILLFAAPFFLTLLLNAISSSCCTTLALSMAS
jgi:hypothetical protein